jgi:hypothetical protein
MQRVQPLAIVLHLRLRAGRGGLRERGEDFLGQVGLFFREERVVRLCGKRRD